MTGKTQSDPRDPYVRPVERTKKEAVWALLPRPKDENLSDEIAVLTPVWAQQGESETTRSLTEANN